jgi:hypothetical protein
MHSRELFKRLSTYACDSMIPSSIKLNPRCFYHHSFYLHTWTRNYDIFARFTLHPSCLFSSLTKLHKYFKYIKEQYSSSFYAWMNDDFPHCSCTTTIYSFLIEKVPFELGPSRCIYLCFCLDEFAQYLKTRMKWRHQFPHLFWQKNWDL